MGKRRVQEKLRKNDKANSINNNSSNIETRLNNIKNKDICCNKRCLRSTIKTNKKQLLINSDLNLSIDTKEKNNEKISCSYEKEILKKSNIKSLKENNKEEVIAYNANKSGNICVIEDTMKSVETKYNEINNKLTQLIARTKTFISNNSIKLKNNFIVHQKELLNNITYKNKIGNIDLTLSDNLDECLRSETFKECLICFDLKNTLILKCKHDICFGCLKEWTDHYNSFCPFCKTNLNQLFCS